LSKSSNYTGDSGNGTSTPMLAALAEQQ